MFGLELGNKMSKKTLSVSRGKTDMLQLKFFYVTSYIGKISRGPPN